MDPTYPTTLNSDQTPQPQKKWWQFSRKQWIIIGVTAVVIAVGGILLGGGNDSQKDGVQSDNAYYDRPGFDRKSLSQGIGDPAALVTKSSAEPISYQAAKVVSACDVLSVEDIRKSGLKLFPNSLTALERNYFDGQSQGPVDASDTSLPASNDGNNCSYILEPKGAINIDVYQPPYAPASALDYEISRRFQDGGMFDGLKMYTRVSEDSKYHMLRSGNEAVEVRLDIKNNDQAAQKILQTVAANFKRLSAAPEGPLRFTYDSPTFKKSYLNGCEVFGVSDANAIFSTEIHPLATERVATATGVIKYTAIGDETPYNYLDHSCTRRAASTSYNDRRSITVETRSYLASEPASYDFAFHKQSNAKVSSVSASIGDEVFFSYSTGQNKELTVRKGRFVVNLGLFDETKRNMSDQEVIQTLTPLAKTLVGRIQD